MNHGLIAAWCETAKKLCADRCEKHERGVTRSNSKKSLATLMIAVTLGALAVFGCAAEAQEAPQKPNIVVILTDDMRYDEFAKIERFREFAREGTFFSRAYVTNSMCCPSRTTVLTGRYSHNHGVLSNKTKDNVRGGYGAYKNLGTGTNNLAAWLQDNGYATSLYGKFMNGYGDNTSRAPRGFDRFYPSDEGRQDPGLGKKAATWIKDHRSRPMFLALWLRSPHEPFRAPEAYRSWHRDDEIDPGPAYDEEDVSDKVPWVKSQRPPSRRKVTAMGRERLRMLEGAAAAIDRVREAMNRWDEENTYFIFYSDNGYMFGEHRLDHKALPYEEAIHIPMYVSGPGVAAGQTRDELVTNNDIAPTVLEWTGAEATRPVDGRSLTPLLFAGTSPEGWRTALLSEHPARNTMPSFKVVRTERHAFIQWQGGYQELYDMGEDPYQLTSLAGTGSEQEEALAQRLRILRDCSGEGCRDAENGPVPP